MLVIFAAGSKEVGLGHLTRMRTLIRRTGIACRVITPTPEIANVVLSDCPVSIVPIDSSFQSLVNHVQPGDTLVLDPPFIPQSPHRSTGPAWQNTVDEIRGKGCHVVRFTDEESPTLHNVDVLINDHPLAVDFKNFYEQQSGCSTVLAGPEFFLIDMDHENAPVEPSEIFISLGGSDHGNILEHVLPDLKDISKKHRVDIVLGAASNMNNGDYVGFNVHHALSAEAFASRLKGAQLAITACGNTLFERAYHGIPGLSIAQFKRQDLIGKSFANLGITRHLGEGLAMRPGTLRKSIEEVLGSPETIQTQKNRGLELNIRKGCETIVDTVLQYLNDDRRRLL